MLNIYGVHTLKFIRIYYCYIPHLLMKSPLCFLQLAIGEYSILYLYTLKLDFHTWQLFAHSTMVLQLNSGRIIYYYMDATQSVGLMWTYFAHPEYLAVQGWIQTTFLYWDTINQTGPYFYHYVKFIGGGYMPLSAPCDCIMAIVGLLMLCDFHCYCFSG